MPGFYNAVVPCLWRPYRRQYQEQLAWIETQTGSMIHRSWNQNCARSKSFHMLFVFVQGVFEVVKVYIGKPYATERTIIWTIMNSFLALDFPTKYEHVWLITISLSRQDSITSVFTFSAMVRLLWLVNCKGGKKPKSPDKTNARPQVTVNFLICPNICRNRPIRDSNDRCHDLILVMVKTRTVIDMASIDRSKLFFQLIEKNITSMSIILSINRKTFFFSLLCHLCHF